MRASKLGLLILILGFGGAVETAWNVRHHLDVGPAGCRVLGGKFYGNKFSFEEEQRRPLSPGTRVEVVNAFGSVETSLGEPGQLELRFEKVVYLDTQQDAGRFASGVLLKLEESGSALRVTTNRDEVRGRDRDVGFETHLRLRLPPGTALSVRNEHGRVDLSDAASVDAQNSYEPMSIRRIGGDATLQSRHGDVTIEQVEGPVSVNARYGDVELREVKGAASLEVEHGDVSASRVASLVASQRYGETTADDVAGELKLTGSHAGLRANRVGGRASVETDYRDVSLANVGGDVSVTARHSAVSVSDAAGAVLVQTSYDDVTLAGITGPADVAVDHGGLRAERLAGGIRARTSGDQVVLESFKGAVDVETNRGGVHLAPEATLSDSVRVTVRNGGIRFSVPSGSRFELEAAVKRGEFEVGDLPGFKVTQSDGNRLVGRMGEGGSSVRLEVEQGDVTLEPLITLAERER